MAAHRRPRRRTANGTSARTAATIALAGAATATGWHGTGHAAPEPTPAQVEATVERLYREAEAATEKYNGAKEQADAAGRRLERLRDEAARKEQRLGTARAALGSVAAAQYRDGGLDPALRLALSAEPDRYLDSAARIERAGDRHATAVAGARRQLREIERLRGAARVEITSLASRKAELKRHRATITGKLAEARRLLSRLDGAEGTGEAEGTEHARADRSAGDRAALSAAGAPNSRAAAAVAYAHDKLGSPYVWGATGPNAFDCSGLTQAAYRAAGVSLPRTTYAQIDAGRPVARTELSPATWSSSTPAAPTWACTWATAT